MHSRLASVLRSHNEKAVMNCQSWGCTESVKNGRVRGKQRYRCKSCGLNFVQGDARVKLDGAVKRALAVLLYAMGKSSLGFIGKLFGVATPAVLKWIRQEEAKVAEPGVAGEIQEMEFDELWHFIGSKKTRNGLSKQWIVCHGEPWSGYWGAVILTPSEGSTIRSSI